MQLPEFRNEPVSDFLKNAAHREGMEQALDRVRRELGRQYPIAIGGERFNAPEKFVSTNPAKPGETLGVFSKANKELAERAIEAADKAFAAWSRASVETRVKLLVDTAKILRDQKFYYAAWMVFEVGKTWPEADSDVTEAIDFCEFYAREMLRYGKPQPLTPVPGEQNYLRYIPLGVGIVIPPWNFPLAITVGMTAASVVTGNTVVLKPSSDSPTIAYKFFEALEQAGMPAGVVNFLTGPGGAVGDALVAHPRTRYIAFTGSKAVGLRINELAAKHSSGQIWIKRVIAEMGGKDSILVDSDSDLDAAVDGVAVSSFGYQGQKCSACSRAIVVENVYDEFLAKLASRVEQMTLGDPANPDSTLGPVVNANAEKQILVYIEEGKKEGRLITGGRASGPGYFIQPTVIADVSPSAKIAQEEIFGPVLAVIKVKNFDEGLRVANNTEYGLTGAVYTNDLEKIERAAREFHVGNLYFNRKCTGAMVGAHPFGGFNMSGTDSKAGGRDYLLLFMQAKSISQRIGKAGEKSSQGGLGH
jgi:1-pyrroline-5-carboxylate dehydrogenase